MEITISYIKQKFNDYNRLMFGGKLPPIPIQLSNAKTFLGQCRYKKRRTLLGKTENYDFQLKISVRIPLTEQEVEDTIIHEMIHYYILANQLKDTSSHGVLFRKMMNEINARFGRHITISHRGTKEQKEQALAKDIRYRVVAVVSFHNGKTGLKVLPRVLPSILKYYNGVLASCGVRSIRLFMSNNTFFARYPSSSALRIHYIDEAEVMAQLEGAERMGCDGKRITRNR